MRGRSKVGSVKSRRRKPAAPKRVSRAETARPRATSSQENEIARLGRDLSESLEQQTATSEILKVISSSQAAVQPVLDAVVASAARLCEAQNATIHLRDGDVLVPHAQSGPLGRTPLGERLPLSHRWVTGRAVLEARTIHVPDLLASDEYPEGKRMAGSLGHRATLVVPLLRKGLAIGAILLRRSEAHPFTERQIALVQNFAAQVVIAIENARLLNELRQSLEQQTATSEVLKVIAASPGKLEPVFNEMLQSATHICEAKFGTLFLYDGNAFRVAAGVGTPPELAEFESLRGPFRPELGSRLERIVGTKQVIHIIDDAAEDVPSPPTRLAGARSIVAVPMLKEDVLIGAISIYRQEVRAFTDKQIALLVNFAAQAVIAIENTRLLSELRESLQQQTATAEVLGVISSSPGELVPVFNSMLENAMRICSAGLGALYRYDGNAFSIAAYVGVSTVVELMSGGPFHPHPDSVLGRIFATRDIVDVPDATQDPGYLKRIPVWVASVDGDGTRSMLGVPMMKENTLIGAFVILRREARPFTDKEVELVKNFAAQAVIAIENARLLNELRQRTDDLSEALEQQTATSEVLRVISSSPGDLTPVFNAMLENATKLCGAEFGLFYLDNGDLTRIAAAYNVPPALAATQNVPFRVHPKSGHAESRRTKQIVHIDDIRAMPPFLEGDPRLVALADLGGARTTVGVPMLKGDTVLGELAVYRKEVRPFAAKQIQLVKNFAAQAVIAIENTRLLNELRQSLEQQTATADVLRVISSSPGALEPVFQAMLENAVRICDARFGILWRYDNEAFDPVALFGAPEGLAEFVQQRGRFQPSAGTALDLILRTKDIVRVDDAMTEPALGTARRGGARSLIIVPMLKDNALIGAITIYRQEVRPFTNKQVELIKNFAAQAVIAIENARLLKELRERTDQLEEQSREVVKLNEQLERRVADQVGEIERMGRLRRFLPPQVADLIVASGTEKQLESHRREITALFCDLRGFTGFSESSDPEDVMALLRDYHAAIGEIIVKYSGTLERFAGDGVMVIFNDPVPVENPALQAVLMALDMRAAIGRLIEKWRDLGHDLGFGIGIAHGFATLGTIGFEGRRDYAAIGTVSNVASRLCDEAKPAQILISPRVRQAIETAVAVESVGEFALKGIRRPMMAYNVLESLPSKRN